MNNLSLIQKLKDWNEGALKNEREQERIRAESQRQAQEAESQRQKERAEAEAKLRREIREIEKPDYERRKKQLEKKQMINQIIITTSSTIPGYEIKKHIDIVTRSNYFNLIDQTEENINKYIFITEEDMLEEMKNEVYSAGGNALINFVISKAVVPVSYVTTDTGFTSNSSTVHFLYGITISMSGTAVILN